MVWKLLGANMTIFHVARIKKKKFKNLKTRATHGCLVLTSISLFKRLEEMKKINK